MPRKSREREREQLRKESKRQRVDVAESTEGAQASQDAARIVPAPAPDPAALQLVDESRRSWARPRKSRARRFCARLCGWARMRRWRCSRRRWRSRPAAACG